MFPIFLYHELRSYIVLESIRYAQPNNNQDFSIGQDELRTFVGIIFFSGYHSFPAKRMYWERSEDVEVRSVYKAMSRNKGGSRAMLLVGARTVGGVRPRQREALAEGAAAGIWGRKNRSLRVLECT